MVETLAQNLFKIKKSKHKRILRNSRLQNNSNGMRAVGHTGKVWHYATARFFFHGQSEKKKQEFMWNKSFDTRNSSDTLEERARDGTAGSSAMAIDGHLFVIR
ncbi:hypothetical protein EVAR_51922_1 [Eumeta japonica]|uniref:Uncharacterized protein n=1 Tax=Eumeta variegata TaxID=151549 RepID=A0A4C1XFN1_EUMVA|nr:hypothetical protein EVAR_51922_1 [Eumeta japonica]